MDVRNGKIQQPCKIEVGLDTGRELITKCLWNPLGLQPVIIALTAEVLDLEKVRFPIPIIFAEVNTRIQLLQGLHEGVIVTVRWDDLVGEIQLALLKRCD